MQIDINVKTYSTKQRILAFFMAFMIFTMTCPELFEGWGIGLIVHAAYDSHIQTGDTVACMSGTSDNYTYSGKMKTGDVTVFDYVSDNETMGMDIDLGVGTGGYHDPYGSFNGAISGNLASPCNENITFIIEDYSAHFGENSGNVYIYLEDSSGNNHGTGWPGRNMTYIGGDKKAYKYVFSTTQASYGGFVPQKIKLCKYKDGSTVSVFPGSADNMKYEYTFRAGYTYYVKCVWNGSNVYYTQSGSHWLWEAKGSENIYTNSSTCAYTNPLYLGMFYITNNASSYTSSSISTTATAKNYNNFHWLTNMGLKNIGNTTGDTVDEYDPDGYRYRGSAAVQGLVKSILTETPASSTATSKGKLRQPDNTELPYFSTDWADDHSALMKYYDHDGDNNIAFPFYEVRTPINGDNANSNVSVNGTTQSGDYAKYYQFSSKDSNLYFTGNSANNSGYFAETNTKIWSSAPTSTVGFFPFDSSNHNNDHTKNNLGFGMKWEMPFTLQPDGCVGVIDSSGNDRDSTIYPERVNTTFEFKGDDDLWVFIDGKLILDMGGDHFEAYGKIDFATGIASVDKAVQYTADNQNNLALPLTAGTNVPTLSDNFKTQIAGYNSTTGTYDSRPHVITIFYMERGMADSNLLIRYNYSTLNNFSKMKIQEITNFDDVNTGLLDATMKAAENDVFKYTVSNTGTSSGDVKTQSKVYPDNATITRTNQGINTVLTTAGTGDPTNTPYNYSPPSNSSTEGVVKNTSYIWVDDFASMNHSTQGTGKTTVASGSDDGGSFFLMYGTKTSTVGTTDKESSAEFGKQFSRYSLMRVKQIENNDYLYRPDRGNETSAATFTQSTRKISDYYTSAHPYIFSNLDTSAKNYLSGNNAQFAFRNNIYTSNYTLGSGTPDENEVVAVQMTEVFENTVKTNTLEIKKVVSGTVPAGTTGYNFTLQLKDVFGTDVAFSNYANIKATKTGNATQTGYIDSSGNFTLTAGQSLTIEGIPYGTKYKITETNPNDGAAITYSTVTTDENGFATLTSDKTSTNAFTVTNTYPSETGVDVLKTNNRTPAAPLEGAELELWYKETSTPPTYYFNDPQVVPYKMNGMKISKSPSEIGIPGLEEVRSSYTVYTETTSYSDPAVPSSEDKDWILPRSDSDYIYFRDYNVGQYAGDNDVQSFSNTTGKRSWRYTYFANQQAAEANNPHTHNQTQELGFNDNYWFAAEFYGPNKKTVKYAMWERFIDKFTYTPSGGGSSTTVDTVVWKIQPPDGYTQVRFILLNGDNWIRSTEKINFKLGEIYHKTSWGGVYSNGNYYDVPTEVEKVWAPNQNGKPDQRNTAMEQPRKYEPTNQKIIFHCNSLQVWHNIHIEFFTSSNANDRVNGQAFPGYMMEPYAYAGSDYRMTDGYLTYELTIPNGATHFRINNGIYTGPYSYRTDITQILNQPNVKNGGNYYILGTASNYNSSTHKCTTYNCLNGNNPLTNVSLYQCVDAYIAMCSDDTTKTYSESNITSDCDYIYFDATSAGWSQVYAYFYGGGNLRDDNWQRACYSAWPGVAPVGTDYWMNDGSTTTTVHSDTYSIKTTGNTYNGTDTSGILSPEATFTLGDKTIYRFRVLKGDRKNYSKVVFNNGLKNFSGGSETGVIEYHTGYIYDKSGKATQYYKEKPTVPYTGRTNSTYTTTDKTEYVYVKNTKGWDNLHITFYDKNGNQILQGGCGYLMDYAGKLNNVEYYRMPIPSNAASFSVNNVKGESVTPKIDIIRYLASVTAAAPKADSDAAATDRFVYDLQSDSTLKRLTYNKSSSSQTFNTTAGQTESTSNYTNGVRSSGSPAVQHTLNIRDNADWAVPIGGVTVTFYNASGTIVGSGTMMKTNPDGGNKVWYTKKIPTDATSFSVIYVKNNTTTATQTYPIYSTTADANGNITTSGHMYYATSGTNQLDMIHTESAVQEADDETYEKRGDSLYLRYDSKQTPAPTVTFYGGSNVIRANVTAKYLNVQDGKYWYEVSIPKGADYFSIGNNSTQYPIYELKTKFSRYQKDYTLGNMQYSVDNSNVATLLYPIFEQDDEYSISVGGNTISTVGSIIPVDESQVAPYANADAETRESTTAQNNVLPVLYETDSTNVSYSWTEGAEDTNIYFEKPSTWIGTPKIYLYNSSSDQNTTWNNSPSMTPVSSSVYKYDVGSNNWRYVIFRDSGSNQYPASGTDWDISGYNYGKGKIARQNSGTAVPALVLNVSAYQTVTINELYAAFYSSSSGGWISNVSAQDFREGITLGAWFAIPDGATYVKFYQNNSQYTFKNSSRTALTNGGADQGFNLSSDGNTVSSFTLTSAQLSKLHEYAGSTGTWELVDYPGAVGGTDYTAAYQAEDRYGYISDVNGSADSDNFITINVTGVSNPYVIFYPNLGGTGTPIGGSTATNGGIKLEALDKDNNTTNNSYQIRLPKNAKSFAIASGPDGTPGAAQNLYIVPVEPPAVQETLTVRADNGQLPPNNYDGNTVDLTSFHHAGSTFSVANDLAITNTAVRANTPVQTDMDNPLNPKSDSDFVFLTVPSTGTWYAYFYGDKDGEYDFTQSSSTITWPGIRDSGSYTDKAGNKVYRFQIPKGNNGTYSYVMFNNGTYSINNITEAVQFTAGGNYTLNTASTKNYGTSVTAYALSTGTKAPTTATTDYSSGDYIYIINNGTQNTKADKTQRTPLDEMHVTFFSDANGSTVVGTGSLDAATNAGYIPDKVGTTNESTGVWTALTTGTGNNNVYRIQVPSGAKYFQINNGLGKGNLGSNYSLRKSEIKALTVNGLYQFIEGENLDDDKYIVSGTFPSTDFDRETPRYLLDLVNILDGGDEELPTSDTVDIHLATVVTGSDGKIASIKWLKDSLTNIDSNYLANANGSGTAVLVKKQGEYYWKEVVAPSGYKVNSTVATFTIPGYNANNPPSITDEPINKGSLSLSKQLETLKQTEANYGEKKKFIFTVVLTAPLGTKWQTLNTKSPLVFQSVTTTDGVPGSSVNVTPIKDSFRDTSLTRTIQIEVPATGLTDVIISNIPSGTAYYVTEESACELTVKNSTGNSVTATVTLTAPTGIEWADYTLIKDGAAITTAGISDNGQTRTVSNISVPANGSVKIGNIPDGTTYSVSGADTANGTLHFEYSKKPTAITKKVYVSATDESTTDTSEDTIEGTIPSFTTDAKNAVDYDVTNKREVGMLTLKDIVIDYGINALTHETETVNQPTTVAGISTTNWYKYDYLVTLTAPEGVDLDDYISKKNLDDITGYYDLKEDPNNAGSLIRDTENDNQYGDSTNVQYTSRNPKTRSATETQSSYTFHIYVTSAEDGFKDIFNIPLGTRYTVEEINPTGTYDSIVTDVVTGEIVNDADGRVEGLTTWRKSGEVLPTADAKYVDAEHRAPVETITNEYWYDYPLGSITIKKKLTTVKNSPAVNSGENQNFTFTVTLNNSSVDWSAYTDLDIPSGNLVANSAHVVADNYNHSYTFQVSVPATGDTGAVTIGGIPNGTTYTIQESNIDSNYTLTSIHNDTTNQDMDTTNPTATQTVDTNTHQTVTYTFTNTRKQGSFKPKKILDGAWEKAGVTNSGSSPTQFTYNVTLEAPSGVDLNDYLTSSYLSGINSVTGTVSYTARDDENNINSKYEFKMTGTAATDGFATISNIPFGTTCTISEDTTGLTYGEYITFTPPSSSSVAISSTYTTELSLTNSYVSKGSLTLQKELSADRPFNVTDDTEFTFRVNISKGTETFNVMVGDTEQEITNGNKTFTVSVSKNAPVTITNIPIGATYTVEEVRTAMTPDTENGGSITGEVKIPESPATETEEQLAARTVSKDDYTKTATITNTYPHINKSITLYKQDSENSAGIPGGKFYLLKLKYTTDINDEDVKAAFASGTIVDNQLTMTKMVEGEPTPVVIATVVENIPTATNNVITTGSDGMVGVTENDNITFTVGDRYFFFEKTADGTNGTTILDGTSPKKYRADNSISAEKVITINSYQDEYVVTYTDERIPNSTGVDIFKTDDSDNPLEGAKFDLYYEYENIPATYTYNDPYITPEKKITTVVSGSPTVPGDDTTTYTIPPTYTFEYTSEDVPSATDKEWILPRSDNDYIYFRDYNTGNTFIGDSGAFRSGDDNTRWIDTWFGKNPHGQNQELIYDTSLWIKAKFTAPSKKTVEYAVWERFVDKYDGKDTVVWKIQPPDGYESVEFILCQGSNHLRNTVSFKYVLGNIYTKTDKGIYNDGQYGYKVKGEHWSTNWRTAANGNPDKRQTYSTFYKDNGEPQSSSGVNKNSYVFGDNTTTGSITSNKPAPVQTERYTPTEQKIVYHCNSYNVWHNIHIEFFRDVDTAHGETADITVDGHGYKVVGQSFPGYLMEPYAYAGSDYRINGYLTYELTIPAEAKYFRVNNGIDTSSTPGQFNLVSQSAYAFRSKITALHDATDRNGRKNYGNYFKITQDDRDVDSTKAITLVDWTSYPQGSGKDSWTETYSTLDVNSDYDYVYFEAPSNWGNHIYAYFYAGGNLRDDNWQRAVYSIWPGEAPDGSEYVDSSTYHSDIYHYSYTGTLYTGTSDGNTNPESVFTRNGTTVYKFRIPKGDRTNYSKVIFNNGLTTQVSDNGGDGKLHETGVISYKAGYIYNKSGNETKHYDIKPTYSYTKRGGSATDDYIYIKTTDTSWDDMHITFYKNGQQILQSGTGYIMEYSGTQSGYTYYRAAIPTDATAFALNNGRDKGSYMQTGREDILRLDAVGDTSSQDYTKDRIVYSLSGTTLTRTAPTFTQVVDNEGGTSSTAQDSKVDYTARNSIVNSPERNDQLYIRDNANWNVDIGKATVKFYDANGTLIIGSNTDGKGTYTLIKTKHENGDNTKPVWYYIDIPANAKTFTVSYRNAGDTLITTPVYDIYPYGDSTTDGNYTATGDMYYQTSGTNQLSLMTSLNETVISTNPNAYTNPSYVPDGTRDAHGGDYLYLVSSTQMTDLSVTFPGSDYTGAVTPEYLNYVAYDPVSPVDGISTSEPNAAGYWYRVAIPKNATTFTVNGNISGTIYPLETKTRYDKDWTPGDMQYRLPDSGTVPTLLYPVFTEDEVQTVEIGGQTIYDRGTRKADAEQAEPYAASSTVALPTSSGNEPNNPYPVLYETSTNTVSYTWGSEDLNYACVRFENADSWNTPITANFNGTVVNAELTTGTSNGHTVYYFRIPEGTQNTVYFTGRTKRTVDITLRNSGHGYMYYPSAITDSTYSQSFTQYNGNYLVQIREPSTAADGVTVSATATTSGGTSGYIWFYYGTSNSSESMRAYFFKDSTASNPSPENQGRQTDKSFTVGSTTYYFYGFKYNNNKYDKVMFFNENSSKKFTTEVIDVSSDSVGKVYALGNWYQSYSWDYGSSPSEPNNVDSSYGQYYCSDVTSTYTTSSYFGTGTTSYSINSITYPNTVVSGSSGGVYTATYQPEDRYNDDNNYIYINTNGNMDKPYVMFYDSNNNAIGGIKQGESAVTVGVKADETDTTNLYRVRLPRGATTFKVVNGAVAPTATAVNLYESDGFHHAGSTFAITSAGAIDTSVNNNGYTSGIKRRTGYTEPSAMQTDEMPKTDADYVFFTDTGSFADNGTVYAYYYGDVDGEYKAWPGVKATNTQLTSYTDNNGKTVYMFTMPKESEGKYSKVIFTNGKTGTDIKITAAADLKGGRNYTLDTTASGKYGTFADTNHVYPVTTSDKTELHTQIYEAASNKYIYIINNGTQDLTGSNLESTRFKLDEMHVVFYDQNSQVIGTGGTGYIPDLLTATAGSDEVYRIKIPNGAVSFQINNGINKGLNSSDTDTKLYERHSAITDIYVSGVYKFVDGTHTAAEFLASGQTLPASESKRHEPSYLLELTNPLTTDERPITIEKVKLATVVTKDEVNIGTFTGNIDHIEWLKPAQGQEGVSPQTTVDTDYLDHTVADLNNPSVTNVKVIKEGKYYWVENSAPTGYKSNPDHYEFEIKRELGAPSTKENEDYTEPNLSVYYKVNGTLVKADGSPLQIINEPEDEPPGEVILTKTAKEKVGTIDIGDTLAGAEFKLVDKNNTSSEIKFKLTQVDPDTTDTDYRKTNIYTVDNSGGYNVSSTNSWLATGEDGKLHIKGLSYGDYYLEEQKAPEGYSNLDSNVLGSDLKPTKKKIYFSVGENREVKEISATDEMEPAYIRLFEHINMKKDEWGDPTFIFKIKQTQHYVTEDDTTTWKLADNTDAKEILVALTVNDDGTITDSTSKVLKWVEHTTATGENDTVIHTYTDKFFNADAIDNDKYGNWLVEATSENEYIGVFDIDKQGRIRVEPGKYEITTVPVSRYEFVTSGHIIYDTDPTTDPYAYEAPAENPFIRDDTQTVTLNPLEAGKTADVHFYHQVAYYDKFSQVDEKINKFYQLDSNHKNITVKGIRIADYSQKGTGENGDTDAQDKLTINVADLTIYKIFADGTEKEMTADEKAAITAEDIEITYTFAEEDNKKFGGSTAESIPAKFAYDSENKKITVTNSSDFAKGVYTLKANYKGFEDEFDIVFKRS